MRFMSGYTITGNIAPNPSSTLYHTETSVIIYSSENYILLLRTADYKILVINIY